MQHSWPIFAEWNFLGAHDNCVFTAQQEQRCVFVSSRSTQIYFDLPASKM